MENTSGGELRRLPLWENCLREMRETGVSYGSSFSRRWMEDRLGCSWHSAAFNGDVHAIRRELELDGLYLSARGQGENGYVILQPEGNAEQARRNDRLIMSLAKRTVALLSATDTKGMTPDQRRRHDSTLDIAARRMALLSRMEPRRVAPTPKEQLLLKDAAPQE